MLSVYRDSKRQFYDQELKDLPGEIIWIDLLNPTAEETDLVEKRAGVRIPTIDALREIEFVEPSRRRSRNHLLEHTGGRSRRRA